jgi:hypothetical protein
MIMRWLLALALVVFAAATAHASVNWVNYLQSDPQTHRVKHYDTSGNSMDVGEDGDLKLFGSDCYYYGMSSAQGWIPNVNSPANGFHVYKFVNCDLTNPKDMGQLLDVTQAPVSTKCVGITPGVNFSACWAPRMIFNASTGKYNFFYEEYASGTQAIQVFDCTTPAPASPGTFPCTYIGPLTGYVAGALDNIAVQGDEQSDDAYLLGDLGAGGHVTIQKLTADHHGLTGSATDTGLTGENVWLAHPGTKWMVGAGTLCAECNNATESFVSSTTALGTYGGLTQVSPTGGCGTQGATVAKVATGSYVYVATNFPYGAGQSQGQTNLHLQPLTLTSDLFDQFTCSGTVTIPGITATGSYPTPAYPRTFDVNFMQSLNSAFHDACNLGASVGPLEIMQQFVPSVASLNAIGINLGKGTQDGQTPDGSVEVAVMTDVANVPGTVLASHTYAASELSWVSQFLTPFMGLTTLTPGTTYDLRLKTVSNTKGCFTYTLAEPSSPLYSPNLVRYTTDRTTWNTISNAMMQISTFPFSDVGVIGMSVH